MSECMATQKGKLVNIFSFFMFLCMFVLCMYVSLYITGRSVANSEKNNSKST